MTLESLRRNVAIVIVMFLMKMMLLHYMQDHDYDPIILMQLLTGPIPLCIILAQF